MIVSSCCVVLNLALFAVAEEAVDKDDGAMVE
jgi:hypothetical protein